HAVARMVDVETATDVLGGKIEFESGEEGRERAILDHLLRRATAETVRDRFRGLDLGPVVEAFDGRTTVSTGDDVSARDFLAALPELPESDGDGAVYDQIAARLGATSAGQRASAVELALEGLFLAQKISKDSDEDGTIYG
ncbi:magnesium chelatase, partial [Kocuria oceani]